MIIRLAVFIFALILILLQCFTGSDSASIDGSFPLENGTITIITDYNRMDQCMAQPGYFHVHHNSLVIFLEKHQFCGGGPHGTEGLLICYKGQLDEKETMRRGLKITRQFELSNLPGNAVAKRCEEAGHPNWHGMLIYTNDQGEWVIKFSTTNRTFVISGKRLEMLVYKLASAKDGGESFLSKTFGPKRDFMEWGKRDGFGVGEEAANRIPNGPNEQLKKFFMELITSQALLRNYVGIWSLGLDMLPTDENVFHLDLYIQKSECCQDIQAFFNLPTAQLPEFGEKKVNLTKEEIDMEASFPENFEGVLYGVVDPTAEKITFEVVDLFQPKDKVQGMKLTVDFTHNTIIMAKKINGNWDKNITEGIKNHFSKGNPFHLVFILGKNGLSGNMNCYGFRPLLGKDEIVFGNIHRIKIYGDFQLSKRFEFPPIAVDNAWMIASINGGEIILGISAENSTGIVLRGNVKPNAKNFSIKLWNKGADEYGFFKPIVELEVGISTQGFYISNGSGEPKKLSADEPTYNDESPFEALILFDEGIFDIWMNNTRIDRYKNPDGLRVVNYIQILGDASGDLIELPKTPITDSETIQMTFENTCALNIIGKVLETKGFKIGLKSGVGNSVPLMFDVKFEGDNSLVTLSEDTGTVGGNQDPAKKFAKLIKIGEDFHLKFQYRKNPSEILVAINGNDHIFTSKSQFAAANQYTISEGVIILDVQFSAPCPCVPSMCPPPPRIKRNLND